MYHTNILSVTKESLSRMSVYKVPKYMVDSKRIFYKITNNYHALSVKRNVSSSGECPWKKAYGSTAAQFTNTNEQINPGKRKLQHGPGLQHFIAKKTLVPTTPVENVPYVQNVGGQNQKVFFDVYGCQMNVNDTAVIWSILKSNGYQLVSDFQEADIILLITCAIRESAEEKISNMISKFSVYKNKRKVLGLQPVKIGVLGCMASRLKKKILLDHQYVDVVAGPDSYKDLPRLLAMTDRESAINVALSMDETYADIQPVRLNQDSVTAFVSIMRGCDNMCTYCIVPFTRGRERSRPISSIVSEIRTLSSLGVKEVTLLGQNVNSYRDITTSIFMNMPVSTHNEEPRLARGFKTVYKNKKGGLRFGDLLDKVSAVNPEMRIRFTSPHPKDFPDDVLQLISQRPNICNHLHVPAQSGNSAVLERMRRGYTREAYVDLIEKIRSIIPNVSLSSDFIAGFCGETDEEFEDTLTLIKEVKYNIAYLFAYSMREKTTAHRRFQDDVPQQVKLHRLQRMIAAYREEADKLNKSQIGHYQLILIEGESKRSKEDLQGRTDGNIKVIIPKADINVEVGSNETRPINVGDYVVVQILEANSQVLIGLPLYHSSIASYHREREKNTYV